MEQMYKINLDGRLDEAAWKEAKEFTGFRQVKKRGGEIVPVQTYFKILADTDRVYLGFYCEEPDVPQVIESHPNRNIWGTDRVEVFISPTGSTYDFYQFVTTFAGKKVTNFYSEGGNIRPDPYLPEWESKVYVGDNYWSVEMEIPLVAFYMSPNEELSTTWLFNAIRGRSDSSGPHAVESSSCVLLSSFHEVENYLAVDGFSMRPVEDDVRMVSAVIDNVERAENGYACTVTVETLNAVKGTFRFSSNHGETTTVTLDAGKNVFTVPGFFENLGRERISLELTRLADGKRFKRFYPVTMVYEPIKLQFTLPEYRCNFYPGQDYSKIVGKVITKKPATLKLEGPGIETQVLAPDAEGNFTFATPNFQEGEAWLTVTIEGEEKKQKIRRLAPTGHMMTWISGGNLIVNGKPAMPREMYSYPYRGSKVLCDWYEKENLHDTRALRKNLGKMAARPILQGILKLPRAEVFEDVMPCDALLRYYDKQIEAHKDVDFAFYFLSDEPECAGLSPIYLKNAYDYISERDPYHVINIVSHDARLFLDCADWFETHPYINPSNLPDGRRIYGRPINTMGNHVDRIAELNRPDKCIGFCPTLFCGEGKNRYADYVTFPEMVCHVWAAIIHGAKSLRPYAFGDMADRPVGTEGIRYIFSSAEALEDILLLGKRTTLYRDEELDAVLYEGEKEKLFVLVNFTQETKTVTVEGLTGTWHNFRHTGTFTGNTFTLAPHEVLIGTSEVRDTGLPTYEEVNELIDKLEAQRIANSSKLVPLRHDIAIEASRVAVRKPKLLNGMYGDLAIDVPKSGERFCELNFTKVDVSFNKVVITGYNMKNNVALKLRVNGELMTPDITETKTEEMSITFLLKETVAPDALRLEFFGEEAMEVYELEAF